MERKWLIRTRSNHILGPVSKEKVLELYNNGSVKPDDELCSGNGYWFYVREEDLVQKYLLGIAEQGFNPISEAKDVLTQSPVESISAEEMENDITLISALPVEELDSTKPEAEIDSAIETNHEDTQPDLTQNIEEIPVKKKRVSEKNSHVKVEGKEKKIVKKQGYMKYLGIFIFIILVLLIYYRKSILKSFFESAAIQKIEFISTAQAQDLGKKKVFFPVS